MNRLAVMTIFMFFGCQFAVAAEPEQQARDLNAIRASLDSYVAAYNRGDAKAAAHHWSDTGEWISPAGDRVQGREAVEKAMGDFFSNNKGVKIEALDHSVRLVTSDVAVAEGTARVIGPDQPPSDSTYIAICVQREGKWQLDSVRETSLPGSTPARVPLEELAWMVGQWVDQSAESTVETSVTWTKNKSFLSCSFKVSVPEMADLEGTQVIGWDPTAGKIRSWMFDSDGGFGEGVWTRKDNRWTVKFTQVLSDGRKASATNIYTCVDADHYTWQSIGRQIDGQFAPNIDEVSVVRKEASQPVPAGNEK